MATDLNVLALVGRLTRTVEMRYTNSGTAIGSFSLAVNRKKKVNDQWVDSASFFDCTYFGKGAEAVSQYLLKGQQVSIQGHIEQQTWQDKNTGENRSKVVVIVQNLTLLGSKNNSQESFTNDHRQQYAQQQPQQNFGQPQQNFGQPQQGFGQPQQQQPQKLRQGPPPNYGKQAKLQQPQQQQQAGPESFFDNIPF